MGNNIRIGKDFNVQWAINKVVDGERLPYDLVGKELQLYIVNDNGRKEVAGWKVQGNVIQWTYLGKDQRRLGAYQLVLVENAGKEGMVTVDTCKAFNLVEHSCEENVDGGSDIVIKTVTLESEVALAPIVKEGDGESYDDTELREAIRDLHEENERLKEMIDEQDQFIEDLQNTKIEKENDDYYPKMAVGLADNLAGVDVVDSEINFRRSGGGAISDGVARIESIKGNSVVWNQKIDTTKYVSKTQNGVTFTKNADGSISVSTDANGATADTNINIIVQGAFKDHYLFMDGCPNGGSTSSYYIHDLWSGRNDIGSGILWKSSENTADIRIVVKLGTIIATPIVFRPRFCDVTQAFQHNTPTTIAEFYARIPMGVDMNAYNEGEVIHMDVQSIESQGVNAWDEEWELGAISTANGADKNDITTQIRSKFIPIKGGAAYYAASAGVTWGFFYDKDKKPISQNVTSTTAGIASEISGITFITPTNARYMRFYLLASYGTTYNHDICINLSDASINGKYFPYIKRVEDLSIIRKYFPDGMKSAGSAHDEIRYNKTTQKWEKVVRIGEVDMADLTLYYNASNEGFFYGPLNGAAKHSSWVVEGNLLSASYTITNGNAIVSSGVTPTDKTLAIAPNGNLYIVNKAYTDAASFKAAMQGVILYYELAEPIVTELDEADQFKDLDYQVWNCGTEKAIAEGKSAPLAADITYGFNAIGKIKELESLVAALRAKVGI